MNTFNRVLWTALLASISIFPVLSVAQGYPKKPITIVSPFPPGGAVDAIARLVANDLAVQLGQSVVVENVTGAGGIIGAAKVSRAKPDGYTLLLNNMSQATVSSFNSNVPYDPLKDFTSIGSVAYIPMIMYARGGFAQGDTRAVLKAVMDNPQKVSVATNGIGSTTFLCQAQFQQSIGAKGLMEVAYKGSGPALIDLAGGVVDMACDTMLGAGAFVQAGKIVPLAVASESRLQGFPNIPTFKELGYQNMDIPLWVAVFGPKGLPEVIRDQLSQALQKIVANPTMRERLHKLNSNPELPEAATPKALDERMRTEAARWAALVKP